MLSSLRRALPVAALYLCLTTRPLPAESLHLVHARHTTSSSDLQDVVDRLQQTGQPAWIAWSVPTHDGVTLGSGDDSIAFLEHVDGSNHSYNQGPRRTDARAILLLRVAAHSLTELRIESPTRTVDAGDLPVVELSGITPEASLAALKRLVTTAGTSRLRDSLVFAISLHGSSSTVPTLAFLTTTGNPSDLREKACFWLGSSSDPAAFAVLQHLARTDPDARLREKLTFDLTLSKQTAATDELIRMAHTDPAIGVRKQAQFWMAHLGGERLLKDLRSSAATDPRHRGPQVGRVRSLAASPGPGHASTNSRRPIQQQSGGSQAGRLLARPILRSKRVSLPYPTPGAVTFAMQSA